MMPTPEETTPPPTPTRRTPRVQVQGPTRISLGGKEPVYHSSVLSVSMGGALIFSNAKLQEDALLQIELGTPIFSVSRLVRARVAHVNDAPADVTAILREKGKADKKRKGYLIGVEFTYMEPDDRQVLQRFIKQQLHDEKKRRVDDQTGEETKHTARERVVHLKPAPVPTWAWGLGFVVGLYEFVNGWVQNASSWQIALHAGVALLVFWFVGRIAAFVWNQLEAWRLPDATIIAHTDGSDTDQDAMLVDADSELHHPDNEEGDDAAPRVEPPAKAA